MCSLAICVRTSYLAISNSEIYQIFNSPIVCLMPYIKYTNKIHTHKHTEHTKISPPNQQFIIYNQSHRHLSYLQKYARFERILFYPLLFFFVNEKNQLNRKLLNR